MSIRPASRKEVYALFRPFWEQHGIIPAPLDSDRLLQCDELFIADIEGEPAGAIALASKGCDGSKGPTLATLYTARKFQQRGVGRSLCEHGIRHFVEAGKTPIFCDVTSAGMHKTIQGMPADLQSHLRLDLSYQEFGDEWAGMFNRFQNHDAGE